MPDPTEDIRRELVARINAHPGSRESLEALYGNVWDTQELARDFDVIGFAAPFVGGWSSARKAKRSVRSCLSSNASIPSGIIESLLTRVYFTWLRGTVSSLSPGIRTTMRCSLSSAIKPVRLRPSLVTTVVT